MKKYIPILQPFIAPDILGVLSKTLYSRWIGEGTKVNEFERALSKYLKVNEVVCTNSCTSALDIALQLSGIGYRDEVISTPLTCIATNTSILQRGATIKWADIDPQTGNINHSSVEKVISNKTKALIMVHFGGYPCDIDALHEIVKPYKIPIIEDAAHAFGSKYKNQKIGSHSDFVCFSFQAVKNITTGDGGAIVCKDRENALKAKKIKWFGIDREKRHKHGIDSYDINLLGSKYNMNDLDAILGIKSLEHFEHNLDIHRTNAATYIKNLEGIPGVKLIQLKERENSNNYLFTACFENRIELQNKLLAEGIESSALHIRNDKYSIFREFLPTSPLIHLDEFAKQMLCLPIGYWVKGEDVEHICELIKKGW
jgi:perosamine synthetase